MRELAVRPYLCEMKISAVALRRKCRSHCHRSVVLFILLFGMVFTIKFFITSKKPKESVAIPCIIPREQRQRLYPLLSTVSSLLSQLSVTHFLCFDSLWGVIQESGPLPWDAHAHLCALNEKVALHDEAELLRAFRRQGLALEYSSAEGQYIIRNSTVVMDELETPTVRIVLFEEDDRVHMLRRVGWRRRILPPDCDAHPSLQCFPPNLAAVPLPLKPFGPLTLPVPREDLDLLKFHYPETWWRPLQPQC